MPSSVVQREERLAAAEAAAAAQQKRLESTERFIERFRYKATKARQVQSRVKALENLEGFSPPSGARSSPSSAFPNRNGQPGWFSGKGRHRRLRRRTGAEQINLVVERGQKLALIGPNGAGKTTLLRMLLGELAAMKGEVTVGNNVDVAEFAQHQVESLRFEATVLEEFRSAVGDDHGRNLRTILGSFGFSGEAAERRVGIFRR